MAAGLKPPTGAGDQYWLNQWAKIISECRISGQTVVREAACETLPAPGENSSIVPVNISIEAAGTGLTETSSPITLRLGSVTLELRNNASVTLIENTLKALQNAR
ncbi:MAG TPA: IS66 family insertion sequence element accessory protein TnpB [Oscillospiraceae bacterium]|nr:IS66 family insertion sequence element accessory protein TnpB [Oscillospiraceae bacterium]